MTFVSLAALKIDSLKMNSCDIFIWITAKQILTLTSNQEGYSLLKLSTIKFLFDAYIFKIGLRSTVKTGAKTSLVVRSKECE
jgi:hypothetical protein